MKKIVILLLINCLVVSCISLPSDITLQQYDITVLSLDTKETISDISAYRIVETEDYGGCIRFLPSLAGAERSRYYLIEKLNTNMEGKATFKPTKTEIGCGEYLSHEYIIVNVSHDESQFDSIDNDNGLYSFMVLAIQPPPITRGVNNPNRKFKGFVLYDCPSSDEENWWHGEEEMFFVSCGLHDKENNANKFVVDLIPY
jgi:hypothetical protein